MPRFSASGRRGLGGFLREEGEIEAVAGEARAVAAAEQKQGLDEADGPGIDRVQAFQDFLPVPGGVLFVAPVPPPGHTLLRGHQQRLPDHDQYPEQVDHGQTAHDDPARPAR